MHTWAHDCTVMHTTKLSDLVRTDSPEAVLEEVELVLGRSIPEFNHDPVREAFKASRSLYAGTYPGYRACNTDYHDFQHITDTFLAMARLVHGAILHGNKFSERSVALGMIAVLFHDAGYIQELHDRQGTGAKHTPVHVRRSMTFLERHRSSYGLSASETDACCAMILCTDLDADIAAIQFPSPEVALLGKILAAADLLAQMADRTYLEKLVFLYEEFREGQVSGYRNELDLLRKTIKFYDLIAERFKTKLDGVDRFMGAHFAQRWNIDADLYYESIERQRDYLCHILQMPESQVLEQLRRGGMVKPDRTKSS